jgi:hypothetical protein
MTDRTYDYPEDMSGEEKDYWDDKSIDEISIGNGSKKIPKEIKGYGITNSSILKSKELNL